MRPVGLEPTTPALKGRGSTYWATNAVRLSPLPGLSLSVFITLNFNFVARRGLEPLTLDWKSNVLPTELTGQIKPTVVLIFRRRKTLCKGFWNKSTELSGYGLILFTERRIVWQQNYVEKSTTAYKQQLILQARPEPTRELKFWRLVFFQLNYRPETVPFTIFERYQCHQASYLYFMVGYMEDDHIAERTGLEPAARISEHLISNQAVYHSRTSPIWFCLWPRRDSNPRIRSFADLAINPLWYSVICLWAGRDLNPQKRLSHSIYSAARYQLRFTYPFSGAEDGTRTHEKPSAWKADALPTELLPHCASF